jgi:hypothetical protein
VELRERRFFSAGVTQAEILQEAFDSVRAIVTGTADRATMRLQMKAAPAAPGLQAVRGRAGTLKDLSSDERINLILDTNAAQVRNYANHS